MPHDETPSPAPPRRYTDEEVRRLLEHATLLQRSDETGALDAREGGGTTLATLQEVAREAGIDPRYVRLAASRIDVSEPAGLGRSLVGAPLLLRAERILSGGVRKGSFERIVQEIQMATNLPGAASMAGGTLVWMSSTSENQTRSLRLIVASEDDETRIQAEERLHAYAGSLFGGVVGAAGLAIGLAVGLGVGIGLLESALFAVAFPVALTGGLYLAMRQAMKSIGRKHRAELDALADRVSRYVEPPG